MNRRRRNLLGLSRHDPALAEALAVRAGDGGLELLRASSGAWTARRPATQGKAAFMHSSMNPLDHSRRALSAAAPAAWKENRAPVGAVCLLLGIGLGWPALAAVELLQEPIGLWLAAPDTAAFSRGLDCLDLDPLWERRRLRLMFGAPDPSVLARLGGRGSWAPVLSDSALDCEAGGRAWALGWLKALSALVPGPLPDPDGLPDWLRVVASSPSRGELA